MVIANAILLAMSVGSAAVAALLLAGAPPVQAQTGAEKCLYAEIDRFRQIEGPDRPINADMLAEWKRECARPVKPRPIAAPPQLDTAFVANAAREKVSLFSLPEVQQAYHAYLRPPGSSGTPEPLPEGLAVTDLGALHALTLVCMDLQCRTQEAVVVDLITGEAALCSADFDPATGAGAQTVWKFKGRPPEFVAAQSCPARVSELSSSFLRSWARSPVTGAAPARSKSPDAAIVAPAPGSPERKAMLDALRPRVVLDLGAPVEFVVRTLRYSGKHGFAAVEAQRPGGGRIDPARTPKGRAMAAEGMLDIFDCCHAEAILERGPDGWRVVEYATGATDVWYEPWYDKLPRGLFAP